MNLAVFFNNDLNSQVINGPEALHISKVLRMRAGGQLYVTNGQGEKQLVVITQLNDKQLKYEVLEKYVIERRPYSLHVAVAPTRKPDRNEWMLEKMVELGVDYITFLITKNTHLEGYNRVVNRERLERIAVSAMKQSAQYYLPKIDIGVQLTSVITDCVSEAKLVAYVPEKETSPHLVNLARDQKDVTVLIGPEGDFTPEEIHLVLEKGFSPCSLGETRLRTETAALMACHAIHLAQL